VVSEKVKTALGQAMEMKAKLANLQRDVADLNRQYQEISQDQQRLRANLKEIPASADAYKRYLAKLDTQETEIEKLQADLKSLRQTEDKQRKEYDAFLLGLNLE
jgi:chromosome segregation ATPase